MNKYMIQCREIILYLVIDFDPRVGYEFVAGAFDFTVIEKPSGSEAIFCIEDEYKSIWHAWDYTGDNTCLVARLKKPENAGHGYSEGADDEALKFKFHAKCNDPDCVFCNEPDWTSLSLIQKPKDNKHSHSGCWLEGQMVGFSQCMVDKVGPLQEQLAAANKRIEELEQWQQEELIVWGPILDYCQDEANAKRLGIGLGQSIGTRVLEILKEIK